MIRYGVPFSEAYRQCFGSLRKPPTQTFLEFAREKGILFDSWSQASGVVDFKSLCELILLEEFKNCVPEQTVMYLNEQKVATLQEAAVLAEEFALTHKAVFNKAESSFGRRAVKTSPLRGLSGVKMDRQCFYCHKLGHIVSDCLALKCKQQQQSKGVGVVGSKGVVDDPELCFKPFIFDIFDGVVSLTGLPETRSWSGY